MSRSGIAGQRDLLALAAITLCGLLLRTVNVETQPLWTDEALTLVLVEWRTADLLLRPVDPTPGLYYILHQLFVPADARLAAIRAISVIAGTLSIPAIYAAGRLAIGRSAGLLAAGLLALSASLIDYSQEARAYALQLLLVLVSVAALLAWVRRLGGAGGAGALGLFAVATVLAFSAHLAAVFWILPAVPLAVALTLQKGTPRQKRWFAVAAALMALAALPEASRLVWRASLGGGFVWLSQAGAAEALSTWTQTLLPAGEHGPGRSAALAIVLVALLAWRLAVHRTELRRWAKASPASAAVIAILLFAPIAVWLFGFVVVPVFMPRTMLVGIPGFILLVALAAKLDRTSLIPLASVAAFVLSLALTGTVRPKEEWSGASAAVARLARPGDRVVHCSGWKYPGFRHSAGASPGGPAVVLLDRRMILFDQGGERWTREYFRTMLEPPMSYLMEGQARLPIEAAALPPFRRAWVVETECNAEARAITRNWLGQGRLKLAWQSAPTADGPRIRIWRFDALTPVTRPVYAIQR